MKTKIKTVHFDAAQRIFDALNNSGKNAGFFFDYHNHNRPEHLFIVEGIGALGLLVLMQHTVGYTTTDRCKFE